jgi:outer membrane protein OmpA-like peptidoglycan-associated protein
MDRMSFHRTLTSAFLVLPLALGVAALSSGCASKKKTHKELKAQETRIEKLEDHAEQTDERFVKVEKKIEEFSETAREALDRAKELGAANTLIDEAVLTEDLAQFKPGSAKLSDVAKSFLAEFAGKLKAENVGVYIEIQGHTDATGDPQSNLRLGERRAQSVYDYLAKVEKLPLHRMRIISYGEEKPLEDNGTPEGRAKNRRVVLVVLK